MGDFPIGVEYVPWQHFGLGAAVNTINYRVEADGDSGATDLDGKFEFKLTGFMLYNRYFF